MISMEPRPWRSSTISIRSRRWLAERRSGPQSSSIEEIDLDQHSEQPCEASVTMSQIEIGEQARYAGIVDGVAVATGFLGQRTG